MTCDLRRIVACRCESPLVPRMDNGPELISQALQSFCDGKVGLSHIPPKNPLAQQSHRIVQRLATRECLNRNHWTNLLEAIVIGDFKHEHTQRHRHSALGYLTPAEHRCPMQPHPSPCGLRDQLKTGINSAWLYNRVDRLPGTCQGQRVTADSLLDAGRADQHLGRRRRALGAHPVSGRPGCRRHPGAPANDAAICPPTATIVARVASAGPSQAADAAAQLAPVEPVSITVALISGVDAPTAAGSRLCSLSPFGRIGRQDATADAPGAAEARSAPRIRGAASASCRNHEADAPARRCAECGRRMREPARWQDRTSPRRNPCRWVPG